GVVLGRWDIRMALDPSLIPQMPDAFDPLPSVPPGTLLGSDGLPARIDTFDEKRYPISIDWDGILVDDPESSDDIVKRVREVFELLWGDEADDQEKKACEALRVRDTDIRNYFNSPTKGFFADHIRRYSKSRRKA